MFFEPNHIYHVYNQGNNRQKIFFNRENYLYFLKKISEHILPYADVLAWCLMPNHFHLMIYVRDSEGFTQSEALTNQTQSEALTNQTQSEALTTHQTKSEALTNTSCKTLNDSIGIMLRSYTRAINKQRNTTGSVFRKMTKAECICSHSEGFTQSETLTDTNIPSETLTDTSIPSETLTDTNIQSEALTKAAIQKEYLQTCFDYIHQNSTKSGLVEHPEKWEFSSWLDYSGIRNGKLINRERAAELGLAISESEGFTQSETLTNQT